MKRAWRLKSESDVQRVWQQGGAYAHPLLILRVRPNGLGGTRVAFVVSKKVGHAVARNRAKRLMREAMRQRFLETAPGYDLVLIGRDRIAGATYVQVSAALDNVLARAGLLKQK